MARNSECGRPADRKFIPARAEIVRHIRPYRGLFPSPPLFDRMPTYRTQGKRSLNFLSARCRVCVEVANGFFARIDEGRLPLPITVRHEKLLDISKSPQRIIYKKKAPHLVPTSTVGPGLTTP